MHHGSPFHGAHDQLCDVLTTHEREIWKCFFSLRSDRLSPSYFFFFFSSLISPFRCSNRREAAL